jgi:hypothetical protein
LSKRTTFAWFVEGSLNYEKTNEYHSPTANLELGLVNYLQEKLVNRAPLVTSPGWINAA